MKGARRAVAPSFDRSGLLAIFREFTESLGRNTLCSFRTFPRTPVPVARRFPRSLARSRACPRSRRRSAARSAGEIASRLWQPVATGGRKWVKTRKKELSAFQPSSRERPTPGTFYSPVVKRNVSRTRNNASPLKGLSLCGNARAHDRGTFRGTGPIILTRIDRVPRGRRAGVNESFSQTRHGFLLQEIRHPVPDVRSLRQSGAQHAGS